MSSLSESWIARATIVLISIAAIFGNALVLLVFIKKRDQLMKTAFDIFIFSLAVSDLLAGIFMFFSRFVFQLLIPAESTYPAALAFCTLLWSGFFLFGLGYVSIYTCTVITIERWLALMKPHFYRRVKIRHALITVTFVWMWSFLMSGTAFLNAKADLETRSCYWQKENEVRVFFVFGKFGITSVFPFSLILILYAHIFYRVKMKNFKGTEEFKRRFTIIGLAASVALILGWLPSNICSVLRYTTLRGEELSDAQYILNLPAFSNSCVNPILYGIYSSRLRDGYKEVFKEILCKRTNRVGIED